MTFAFSIQIRSGCSKRGWQDPTDQPIVQSLEPAACFVPYLLNNAGRACGGFPDAWAGIILVTLVSSAQAQLREQFRDAIDRWRAG
jgi:hypothetical protein